MTREDVKDLLKFIIRKCDLVINNENYTADEYAQDKVEDIAEMCHRVLDGQFGEIIESSLSPNIDEAADNCTYSEHAYARESFKEGAEWRNAQIPKLPDNVDEAAEKYADTQNKNFLKPEIVKNIFKAGAEWIAGQGASFNTKVGWIVGPTVLDWPDDILDKFKMSDEVIVQIRKKQL